MNGLKPADETGLYERFYEGESKMTCNHKIWLTLTAGIFPVITDSAVVIYGQESRIERRLKNRKNEAENKEEPTVKKSPEKDERKTAVTETKGTEAAPAETVAPKETVVPKNDETPQPRRKSGRRRLKKNEADGKTVTNPSATRTETTGNAAGAAPAAPETPPEPNMIMVTVNVPEARILIGEKTAGVARRNQPLTIPLSPGVIRLSATSPNYLPFSQEVEISPRTTRLEIMLDYDVGALLARYENPQTTGLITAEDWEAVAETANRKLQIGDLRVEYHALALFAEGQLALRLGDTTNAIPRFLDATHLIPNSAVAGYALGQAFLTAGDFTRAAEAFQRAVANNPVFALAYYGLAESFLKQGKAREALAGFERAEALGYAPPGLPLQAARALVAQQAYDAAIARLKPLLSSPSVEALVILGDAFAGKKKNDTARETYEMAALRDPTSPLPPARLGELLFRTKKYREAQYYLRQALELDPDGRLINAAELRAMLEKTLSRKK